MQRKRTRKRKACMEGYEENKTSKKMRKINQAMMEEKKNTTKGRTRRNGEKVD
jgi:hypothetical protein